MFSKTHNTGGNPSERSPYPILKSNGSDRSGTQMNIRLRLNNDLYAVEHIEKRDGSRGSSSRNYEDTFGSQSARTHVVGIQHKDYLSKQLSSCTSMTMKANECSASQMRHEHEQVRVDLNSSELRASTQHSMPGK